jgi:hypothetical protein
LKDKKDPAHEKRMQIANNDYLMDNVLGVNDNLTHIEQRNKYIQFNDPYVAEEHNGLDAKEQQSLKNNLYEESSKQ